MGSRDHLTQEWRNLDATLSELAKVTISIKEKKLIFVLGSVCNGECMPLGRRWLPELLPRFYGLGELRVECGRSRLETCCFCDHQPTCVEEEYDTTQS